jgi:predicted transcriptional regulator
MQSVLISIRPQWCELIASGKKTIEVRKSRPKLETPFKCYIYRCLEKHGDIYTTSGKVIGEFVCDNVHNIQSRGIDHNYDYCYESLNVFGNDDIEIEIRAIKASCIKKNDLNKYANGAQWIYGWHISALQIYDKPRELSEFGLTRPFQSWGYVEEYDEKR